jgi:hypothetical protein
MPTRKPFVKAYLSPAEYVRVSDLASRSNLSKSELVRRLCLGREIQSRVDQRAVLALLKSNADLGRLGGLLKQHLAGGRVEAPEDLRRLLQSLETTKRDLAAGMRAVIRQLLNGQER